MKETSAQRSVTPNWPKEGSVVKFQLKLNSVNDPKYSPERTGTVDRYMTVDGLGAVQVLLEIDGSPTSRIVCPALGDKMVVV